MKVRFDITDLASLSPIILLITGSLIILLIESFIRKDTKTPSPWVALLTFGAAAIAIVYAPQSENPLLTSWLRFDSLAHTLNLVFVTIGAASVLLAYTYLNKFKADQGEYCFLLLSSVIGLILISSSADFLILFLGLETLSISLYILCGYIKKSPISQEAAIKYFLTGSIAAAVFLYGTALIYGAVGTLHFASLLTNYKSTEYVALFHYGIGLITVGLAFKAAIVPFHMWAPDVYEGAPTPVTAFMAVGTKAGAFAAFIVVFLIALPNFNPLWNHTIAWAAFPTLIYANFVALRQVHLRRFFAYSGISHAGYLLIPLAVGSPEAIPALVFYLIVYVLATLGCFAVLTTMEKTSMGVVLQDLRGLFFKAPFLSVILTLCLFTLAGIPPTVGFFAKFYLFKLGWQAGYYALVIVALLMTIISAYYYLRMIAMMYSEDAIDAAPLNLSWPSTLLGITACIILTVISIYPSLIQIK